MVDLKAQLARIRPEVDAAVERVITSAQFIQGEDCHRLEQEFAAWCGASHACAVANGTDALILALRAALRRIKAEGMEGIWQRHRRIVDLR